MNGKFIQTFFGCSVAAACLLAGTGCTTQEETSLSMQYIKTSVLYDTLVDMYDQPDAYLGNAYHLVGELYEATDHATGEPFYSVYARDGDEGIGLELDWNDYTGLAAGDRITVEGTLDSATTTGEDGQKMTYLILRVTMLEKRA